MLMTWKQITCKYCKKRQTIDITSTVRQLEYEEMLEVLQTLVGQLHAYETGWLGRGDAWRTRIGLPADLKRAEAAIRRAKGAL